MERWRRTALAAERAWENQRVATAIRLYRKAAGEAERAGETVMLGMILNNLGLALDQEGNGQGVWLQGAPEGLAGAALLGYPGLPPTEAAASPAAPAKAPERLRFLRWLRRAFSSRRPAS